MCIVRQAERERFVPAELFGPKAMFLYGIEFLNDDAPAIVIAHIFAGSRAK